MFDPTEGTMDGNGPACECDGVHPVELTEIHRRSSAEKDRKVAVDKKKLLGGGPA